MALTIEDKIRFVIGKWIIDRCFTYQSIIVYVNKEYGVTLSRGTVERHLQALAILRRGIRVKSAAKSSSSITVFEVWK